MSDKIKVEVMVEGRVRWACDVEMTREEYEAWCDRIDNARGYEEGQAAEELLDLGGVDVYRDMDVDSMRVEDFIEATP